MNIIRMTVVLLLLGFATESFAAKSVLDGKTYVGTVKMGEDAKGDPDNFIFKNGTFRSSACDQYGYTEAPYAIEEKRKSMKFTATTKNKEGAAIKWNGTISGDKVEGTANMTTASGETTPGSFTGALKK